MNILSYLLERRGVPLRIWGHSTFETSRFLFLICLPKSISRSPSLIPCMHTHIRLIKRNLQSSYSHGCSIIKIYRFPAPYGYNRIPHPVINACSTSLTLAYPRNPFLGEETKLHLLSQWSSRENEIAQHIRLLFSRATSSLLRKDGKWAASYKLLKAVAITTFHWCSQWQYFWPKTTETHRCTPESVH